MKFKNITLFSIVLIELLLPSARAQNDEVWDQVDGTSYGLSGSGLQYEKDGLLVQSYSVEIENSEQLNHVANQLSGQAVEDSRGVPESQSEVELAYWADAEMERTHGTFTPKSVVQTLQNRIKERGGKVQRVTKYGLGKPLKAVGKLMAKAAYPVKMVTLTVLRLAVTGTLVYTGMVATYGKQVAFQAGTLVNVIFGFPFAAWNNRYSQFLDSTRVTPRSLKEVKEWISYIFRGNVERFKRMVSRGWASQTVELTVPGLQARLERESNVTGETHPDDVPFFGHNFQGQVLSNLVEATFATAVIRTQEYIKIEMGANFDPVSWIELGATSVAAGTAQGPIDMFTNVYREIQELLGVPEKQWKVGQRAWSTLGSITSVTSMTLFLSQSGPVVKAIGGGGLIFLYFFGKNKLDKARKELVRLKELQSLKIEEYRALSGTNEPAAAFVNLSLPQLETLVQSTFDAIKPTYCGIALEGGLGLYDLSPEPIDFSHPAWAGL